MKRWSTLLAWFAMVLVAALAAVNWATLTASAPLNLLVAQIQAPLGVVLLAMTAALAVLFALAHLRIQIGSMVETRRLLDEVRRAQELADKAEASRLNTLQALVETEFRRLNERIERIDPYASPTGAPRIAPVTGH